MHCTIDLTDGPYIDSAALGVLLGHFAPCQRNAMRMALVGMSPRAHTIFEITHTDQILPIYPTRVEAQHQLAAA